MNSFSGQHADGPLAVLVVSSGVLSDRNGPPPSARTFRLASGLHPSPVAFAATVSTGHWPETHGVVNGMQPHPDRLGWELASPERATKGSIWSAAAYAGRHVAVGSWPHAMLQPDLETGGRLDRIETRAVEALSGEPPAVLPPGSVEPGSMRDLLRPHHGEAPAELNCISIEGLAGQGPDLLLGWLPAIPGEIHERRARIDGIRRRLTDAGGGEATLLVLEHPPVSQSIFRQSLKTPSPLLHVFGPREVSIKGRPRVDVVSRIVSREIGIDPESSRFRMDPPSGGHDRLEAAGIPGPIRISAFDLKQFEFDRNREIGASLVARGLWGKAEPWLSASIQTQHGRIDLASLVLMLIRIRRARGEKEASRLLGSVMQRFPKALQNTLEAWLAGRPDELGGEEGRAVLNSLGTFLAEAMLIDLRRRGLLGRAASDPSDD